MQPLRRLSGVHATTAASASCDTLPGCVGFSLVCQHATGCPQVGWVDFFSCSPRASLSLFLRSRVHRLSWS
jgi:hypothetical protein